MDTLYVRPYHWEYEENRNKPGSSLILAWCHDRNSNPVCLRIEDYAIFFDILLEDTNVNNPIRITEGITKAFYSKFVEKIQGYEGLTANILYFNKNSFKRLKPLYYAQLTSNTQKGVEDLRQGIVKRKSILRIRLSNSTRETIGFVNRALSYPLRVDTGGRYYQIKGTLLTKEFTPIDKMFVEKKIRHTSWLEVPCNLAKKKISTLEREYIIGVNSFTKVDESICGTWTTNPSIFSFDFECDTPNKRKFPDLWDHLCPITMVSCGYMNADGSDKKSYTIVVGDCPPSSRGENFSVIIVNNEIQLLDKMCALIAELDPDIITGYNIQSFDIEYADARYIAKGKVFPKFSRLIGRESFVKTETWESQAYSSVKVSHLYCPGRIVIDVIQEAKRNNKFPSYKLDFVANHFLKAGKVPVTPYEMFCSFEIHREGLKAGKGTPEYDRAMEEISRVVYYCEEDADLCLKLFQKMKIWVNAVETANVMRVNIYDLFTRGQQIRCLSQLFEAAFDNDYYLDSIPMEKIPFEGGKVQDPIPGVHEQVMVIDFQSLYPSIIQAYNICYTTYVKEKDRNLVTRDMCNIKAVVCDQETDPNGDDEVNKMIRFVVEENDEKIREFWFVKEEYLPGLLPTLVKKLCIQRRIVQKMMETEENPEIWDMLNKKQIAIKVSTNSFFGFLGVLKNGKKPFRPAAVAITSWGRELITTTNNYLIDNYGAIIVYGDTDSSMVRMPNQITSNDQCDYWVNRICDEITNLFPDNIIMEKEYCGKILCIKKKKYVFYIYDVDGSYKRLPNGDIKKSIKGIMSVRRENCKWARQTYDKVIEMIMNEENCFNVLCYIVDRIEMIINGEIPYNELMGNKAVAAHYKESSKNAEMKLFSENMRNNYGKVIEAGERLNFLVVKNPTKKYKGEKMVMEDVYLNSKETDNPLEIDYIFYVEKMLMNHVDNLMYICYYYQLERTEFSISFKKTPKSNCIRHITPVQMIVEMLKNGATLDHYREMLLEYEEALTRSTRDYQIEYGEI